MEKSLLEEYLTRKFSTYMIAKETSLSPTTVRYWIKKHGLSFTCPDGPKPKEVSSNGERYCPACQELLKLSDFYERRNRIGSSGWCKKCSNQCSINRQQENKVKAVELKGGGCDICSYNKYLGALEWHHSDPSAKDPSFSSLKTASWDRYWVEVEQCMLLCANCHREEHHRLRQSTRKWT